MRGPQEVHVVASTGGQEVNESQAGQGELLGLAKAARHIRMSEGWLKLHAEEIGYLQMGGQKRFRIADLDAYVEKARRGAAVAAS
jgi:hypothetical protein